MTLNPITNITHNTLTLSWTKTSDPAFESYQVYRSTTPGPNPSYSLVATISDINTTLFNDVGLSPKTTYYYIVYVKDSHGMFNGSNEVSGITLFGLEYPFADNMEMGDDNWLATGEWTRISLQEAHSGNICWTDSPVGDYPFNSDTSLELLDERDINPNTQLVFWHQLHIASGDTATIEISTDGGFKWDPVKTYTGQNIPNWERVQIDLGDSHKSIKIRFRLQSDDSDVENGWYIDDVTLSDLPDAVTLNTPIPQKPDADRMAVSWSVSLDTHFKYYALYRSTDPNVDLNDTLVTTINDPGTNRFMDTGLSYTTTYYYKIYVVNRYDAYNGSNEKSASTTTPDGVVGFPYSDDTEGGKVYWVADSPWGLTKAFSHSGSHSWTESPQGSYGNYMDISLALNIDLSSAQMPTLTYWQCYSIETNKDYGYLEVSTDRGTNWHRLSFITGSSTEIVGREGAWIKERVDLAEYAGYEEVKIRFRFVSDSSGTGDGWYIDDVWIGEDLIPDQPVNWCKLDRPSNVISMPGQPSAPIYGLAFEPGITDLEGRGERIIAQLGYGPVDTNPALGWTWVDASYYGDANALRYDEYAASLTVDTIGNYHYAYRFSMDHGENWIYADLNGNDTGGGGYNTYTSDQAGELTVVQVLSKIRISPDRMIILNNSQVQFSATGFDDSNQPVPNLENVMWSVNGPIGTIDDDGLFTGTTIGVGSISGYIINNGIKKDSTSIIEVVSNAAGTTQHEGGKVHNANNLRPADGSVLFNAYITSRPKEVLTQDSPGCGFGNGEWGINIGNFPTPWAPGETLRIDFIDITRGETGTISYSIQYGGQTHDMTLAPISFNLITTSTTNVNSIVLTKDSGVSSAEGLANEIANATEVAYWDGENQAYVAHSKGSALFDFPVTPGCPYFITVSSDSSWTPTGTVPSPWPTFRLITTSLTDVNMIGLPLSMMRLVRAQEVCQVIPNVREIALWAGNTQAYEAHTKDTPINDFAVHPGMAYFLTMEEEEQWISARTLASGGSEQIVTSGITQNEGGYIKNSDGSVPVDDAISFSAYIKGRENEVLTQSSPGCGYGSGYWQVNVGNFPYPWDAGDILHVDFYHTVNCEAGSLDITLQYAGQRTDITLSPSACPCEGDFTMDGDVDGTDLAVFALDFCRTDCGSGLPCEGDFDNDGDVDGTDLAVFASDFGRIDCP